MKRSLIILLFLAIESFSQNFEELKLKYPTEDVVTLTNDEYLKIDLHKGRLSISNHYCPTKIRFFKKSYDKPNKTSVFLVHTNSMV